MTDDDEAAIGTLLDALDRELATGGSLTTLTASIRKDEFVVKIQVDADGTSQRRVERIAH